MASSTQKQRLFTGRDHSWMQFNRRVLEEAEDPSNPLLERVKSLAITGSNLDEYVEIRQAGLMQRIEDGYREPGYDGLRPDESLAALTSEIHSFVDGQYRCWNDQLLPELRKQGIRLLDWEELGDDARTFAQTYFQREVDPLLTPIAIDPAHPFPRVLNKALCLALLLRRKRKSSGPQVLGVVTVPRALPRFVRLPGADGNFDYLLLQDLIAQNLAGMYRGYEVLARAAFRVTRNSNLYFEEEEARSLLETIRVELHNRRKGDAVRLEIETGAEPEIVERLRVNFELDEDQVFHGVVGLKTHCKLALLVRRDEDGVTRRYCHLGTGNYNPITARFYTDLSLLTSDPQVTERVHMVFNYLTAHAEVDDYRPLLVAPLTMAESFLGLIRREMEHARQAGPRTSSPR